MIKSAIGGAVGGVVMTGTGVGTNYAITGIVQAAGGDIVSAKDEIIETQANVTMATANATNYLLMNVTQANTNTTNHLIIDGYNTVNNVTSMNVNNTNHLIVGGLNILNDIVNHNSNVTNYVTVESANSTRELIVAATNHLTENEDRRTDITAMYLEGLAQQLNQTNALIKQLGQNFTTTTQETKDLVTAGTQISSAVTANEVDKVYKLLTFDTYKKVVEQEVKRQLNGEVEKKDEEHLNHLIRRDLEKEDGSELLNTTFSIDFVIRPNETELFSIRDDNTQTVDYDEIDDDDKDFEEISVNLEEEEEEGVYEYEATETAQLPMSKWKEVTIADIMRVTNATTTTTSTTVATTTAATTTTATTTATTTTTNTATSSTEQTEPMPQLISVYFSSATLVTLNPVVLLYTLLVHTFCN